MLLNLTYNTAIWQNQKTNENDHFQIEKKWKKKENADGHFGQKTME